METFFRWLEDLPFSQSIAGSSSVFGFALVLCIHTIGIALTAGPAMMVSLRLLGVAPGMSIAALRTLFKFFWTGFILNLLSGTLLFMMAATSTGYKPMYYAKLLILALALAVLRPIAKVIRADDAEAGILPPKVRRLAMVSFALWIGVIATGRLIAYSK